MTDKVIKLHVYLLLIIKLIKNYATPFSFNT